MLSCGYVPEVYSRWVNLAGTSGMARDRASKYKSTSLPLRRILSDEHRGKPVELSCQLMYGTYLCSAIQLSGTYVRITLKMIY